jgi:hypothetical protein
VTIFGARLHLKVNQQRNGPKLPKNGEPGELLVIHSSTWQGGAIVGEDRTLPSSDSSAPDRVNGRTNHGDALSVIHLKKTEQLKVDNTLIHQMQ